MALLRFICLLDINCSYLQCFVIIDTFANLVYQFLSLIIESWRDRVKFLIVLFLLIKKSFKINFKQLPNQIIFKIINEKH